MEHELAFDLSSPKTLIGLLIGGSLPYFLLVIPAALTKWLLFRSVIRKFRRPGILRLCCVAIAEPFCFFLPAIAWVLLWPAIGSLAAACALYPVLAMFTNLLLIPSVDRSGRAAFVKKVPYAFGMGLIYQAMCFSWVTGCRISSGC